MKLTGIELHHDQGNFFNPPLIAAFSFRDPKANNPYNIKSVVGLDAEAIMPRYTGGSGLSTFYNMSLEDREIVFKVGLNPNFSNYESYSDLRDDLYKGIASSRTGKVTIQFKNYEDIVGVLYGFISKIEAPLFEKTQEVQITIKCNDPMIRDLYNPTVVHYTGDPETTDNCKVLVPDIKSTAPHGGIFTSVVTGSIGFGTNFSISDPNDSSWSFRLGFGSSLPIGSILTLSSEYNNKYLNVTTDGVTRSAADAILAGSSWPIIFPGENQFHWDSDLAQFQYIAYYPSYWGI